MESVQSRAGWGANRKWSTGNCALSYDGAGLALPGETPYWIRGRHPPMEEQLSLDFLRVVENAAIAAARTMGFGDRHHADEVAVEAMRKTMDSVEIDGTIVIGEGERDEAPMLYIGEKVGLGTHAPKALFPQVDIAV